MQKIDFDVSNYPENGCVDFGEILDPAACSHLREWINVRRPVNRDIFYSSEEEFRQKGRWVNYAPGRTSHNLLLDRSLDLRFIEENPRFVTMMERLCGVNYEIFKKSIIRSVPVWAAPEWIVDYMLDVGRPNMNPFVKDEFQDVQYFLCTDFHQDKTRPESDFATVYIYLDEVDPQYSALQILVGSHKLGMTTYPHSLRRSLRDPAVWFYSDGLGNHMQCSGRTVTGSPGSVTGFHCMTLHGTGYNQSRNPRISLRYLIKMNSQQPSRNCLHAEANEKIIGPKKMLHTRVDVGVDGAFQRTGSSLHSYDDLQTFKADAATIIRKQ